MLDKAAVSPHMQPIRDRQPDNNRQGVGAMRVRSVSGLSLLAALLVLGGCTSSSVVSSGAASLGAFAGGQSSGNTPGVAAMSSMMGGLAAGPAGARLGDAERRLALAAEFRALEQTQPGDAVAWRSETGAFAGQVVPGAPYRVGSQDCRQYTHTVSTVAGTETARGTACRNPDGTWALLS